MCRNNVVLDSSLLVGGSFFFFFFFFFPSDQVSFIIKFSLIKWKYISADLSADEIRNQAEHLHDQVASVKTPCARLRGSVAHGSETHFFAQHIYFSLNPIFNISEHSEEVKI